MSLFPLLCAASALAVAPARNGAPVRSQPVIYVSAARGNDDAPGTETRPLRSLSGAVSRLPDPVIESTIICVSGGRIASTGGVGMPQNRLDLARRMSPGVSVSIVGQTSTGTSRTDQSSLIAVNNSGCVDLPGTPTRFDTPRRHRR